MAFFGVIVSPGRPYVLPTAPGAAGRLHLSLASLGDGTGKNTVSLCCTVGNKIPIIIARLIPRRSESLSLDLHYTLSEETTFSVIGPRNVHLAGYFLRQDASADSESFGEDVARTESEKSVDDDTYEDSFINDSDPGYLSSSAANSSFVANECSSDDKPKLNERKSGRRQLRKVQIESSTESSEQSGVNETKNRPVVSDSGSDFEFHENSLLRRMSRANGSSSISAVKDLTRNSEKVNVSAEKSVLPDTKGLSVVGSTPKRSMKRKESKEESNNVDQGRPLENGNKEGELRQIPIGNVHISGKPAPSHQMMVEAASESKAKKKKHVKGDPNLNVNEQKFHEAGKPEPAMPQLPQTSKETDLELKSKKKKKKKKKKKHVEEELRGTDEHTKEWISGFPNTMDEEKQLASANCVEADHAVLQSNELAKDDFVKVKTKKKAQNDTKRTNVILATAEASPAKIKDESNKEESVKCKKKRKRCESSDNAADEVNNEPRVWTTPNGVVVEDLVKEHPADNIPLPGKKLSIHFVAKLEGSNDMFITTFGDSPLKFHLSGHEAVTRWNECLEAFGPEARGGLRYRYHNHRGIDPAGSRMIYEIEVLRIR